MNAGFALTKYNCVAGDNAIEFNQVAERNSTSQHPMQSAYALARTCAHLRAHGYAWVRLRGHRPRMANQIDFCFINIVVISKSQYTLRELTMHLRSATANGAVAGTMHLRIATANGAVAGAHALQQLAGHLGATAAKQALLLKSVFVV